MKNILPVFILAGCLLTACSISDQTDATVSSETESTVKTSSPAEHLSYVTTNKPSPQPTVEETLLLEHEGITITATGLESTSQYTYLKLLIDNTSDQVVSVRVEDITVNDYMVDTYFSVDVAAGKKANAKIRIDSSDLDLINMDYISHITIKAELSNPDTYEKQFISDPILVKTNFYDEYIHEDDLSGTVIYDEDGLTIIARDKIYKTGTWEGPIFFISNTSENDLALSAKETSVNGNMISAHIDVKLLAGTKRITIFNLLTSDLEENDIKDINDIEFKLKISDPDSYSTLKTSEPITLSPRPTASDNTNETVSSLQESSSDPAEDAVLEPVPLAYATIEETLLYNHEGVSITATGLDYDEQSARLKLQIENTTEYNISIFNDYVAVNDYMIDTGFVSEVSAGEMINTEVPFTSPMLERIGADNISHIDIKFFMSDANEHNILNITDIFNVKTSNYNKYIQKDNNSGTVIYDEDGLTIIVRDALTQNSKYKGPEFFITNTTDKTIGVVAEHTSVNGYMVEHFFYSYLPPGKKDLNEFDIPLEWLSENSIKTINEIEFRFAIAGVNSFGDIITTDPITLHFD